MTARCPRCGLRPPSTSLGLCPRCLLLDDDERPAAPPGLALEGELGRGGMGRVFRARHLRLDRPVAVKFLPPELAAEPGFEARFAREARALARLSHPSIVGVHDFGTTDAGESYLVMELVPAGTLASRLPVSAPEAVAVALQICDALAYAHERGLVHRDIKPENVLYDADGRVKLADFGLARLADPELAGPPLTRPSLVMGTPGYMAPEARAGAAPDPRMDVFAVGVMLRQMITGRLPGDDRGGPVLPAALVPVVARAVAPLPGDRWPSAAALREALAAARAHLPAAPPSAAARPDTASTLPPEEQSWQRAVALALAGATAVALYAVLVSVTPRTVDAGDSLPLISFGAEARAGGRVFSRARFETWPTLAAAAAFAVALGAYGLLRRHWRHAGLDLPAPDRPLPAARAVVKTALVIFGLFVVRLTVDGAGARAASSYLPVVGGVLELMMVYGAWIAFLEARRVGRSLGREPLLWAGVALALVPPLYSLGRVLTRQPP